MTVYDLFLFDTCVHRCLELRNRKQEPCKQWSVKRVIWIYRSCRFQLFAEARFIVPQFNKIEWREEKWRFWKKTGFFLSCHVDSFMSVCYFLFPWLSPCAHVRSNFCYSVRIIAGTQNKSWVRVNLECDIQSNANRNRLANAEYSGKTSTSKHTMTS